MKLEEYFKKPRLQVALDLLDLGKAVEIAKKCVEGGVDIIEVGTPLIKSLGVKSVEEIRREFPDEIIFADMKTMDLGALEAKLAFEKGADVVGVAGAAPNTTIMEAVEEAEKWGRWISADLIGVKDLLNRSIEVAELGVHIVELHVSVDEQRRLGLTAIERGELIEEVSSKLTCPLAVAGGINAEKAEKLVLKGAKLIIVGSSIVKSKNPRLEVEKILRGMGRI